MFYQISLIEDNLKKRMIPIGEYSLLTFGIKENEYFCSIKFMPV